MKFSFFPTKNIEMSQSIFCIGGFILKILKKNKSLDIDELYKKYKITNINKKHLVKFELFLLSLDYLFIINAVLEKKGRIYLNENS